MEVVVQAEGLQRGCGNGSISHVVLQKVLLANVGNVDARIEVLGWRRIEVLKRVTAKCGHGLQDNAGILLILL